jgi:hypothetical protein
MTKQSQFKTPQTIETTTESPKTNWLCFGFASGLHSVCYGSESALRAQSINPAYR